MQKRKDRLGVRRAALAFLLSLLPAVIPVPLSADEAPTTAMDAIKKKAGDLVQAMPTMPAMPSVSMPNMPDFAIPDFSHMKDSLYGEFKEFTNQVGDTLPVLQAMGYEVTTFRVQFSLSPKAKLRLKSKTITDPDKVAAAAANAPKGVIASAMVSSAVAAKGIQSAMKMGTVLIDIDFAVPPKIRMSFLPSKQETSDGERSMEDMDLACSQAFSDK